MTPESRRQTAEIRVLDRYAILHKDLLKLVDALQKLEPTGVFVDQVKLKRKGNGRMQILYKARPTTLIIEDGGRRFRLRLDEIKHDRDA